MPAAAPAPSSSSSSSRSSSSKARDFGILLLSLAITFIGRVYRRLGSFLHRLPPSALALRRRLLGPRASSCGCGSGGGASSSSSSSSSSGPTSSSAQTGTRPGSGTGTGTGSSRAPSRLDQHTMLPTLPNVQRLSPRVVRILGLNPGAHTLQGTCTYLLGTGKRRILVDTGEGRPGYPALLAEALQMAGAEEGLEAVLLTHHHYDHVGGLHQVRAAYGGGGDLPVYKRLRGSGEAAAAAAASAASDSSSSSNGIREIEDGAVFRTEGATLHALLTPGHTDDHVAFWLEEEGALLSGDCVLGHGTTVFDDLYTYMASLRRLLRLARGQESLPNANAASTGAGLKLTRIYPGHGAIIDDAKDGPGTAVGVLESYVMHRELRERQILGLLLAERDSTGNGSGRGLSPLHIVQRIYDKLPAAVVMSAQWNVEHHLDKLRREGKAVASSPLGLWRATPGAAMD